MTAETNRAAELAESLRAMRRNAVAHWAPHGQVPRYAVTMDQIRLGDLSDAADMLERMSNALAEAAAYLVAAADGSMSRNNSEVLAAECLEVVRAANGKAVP